MEKMYTGSKKKISILIVLFLQLMGEYYGV